MLNVSNSMATEPGRDPGMPTYPMPPPYETLKVELGCSTNAMPSAVDQAELEMSMAKKALNDRPPERLIGRWKTAAPDSDSPESVSRMAAPERYALNGVLERM